MKRRGGAAARPRAGEEPLRGGALERVVFDPDRARVELVVAGRRCVFEEVRATTLLAPWDGTPGTVEWLRVAAADETTLALELRVRWREVPRVYRIVCGALRLDAARGRRRRLRSSSRRTT